MSKNNKVKKVNTPNEHNEYEYNEITLNLSLLTDPVGFFQGYLPLMFFLDNTYIGKRFAEYTYLEQWKKRRGE